MKKILSLLLTLVLMVSLVPQAKAANTDFKDVPKSHPNYADIMFLLDKGVIPSGTYFGVNNKVTRDDVAVMVAKAVGLDGKKTKTKFKDVPESWHTSGYINSAVNAGIINGYPDGTFKPSNLVTRGHMAAFIANAFKLTGQADINFKDVPKGSTSYVAVKKLAYSNITSGYPDGTFKPNESLTKAHISAFLARAIRNQENSSIKQPVVNNPIKQPEKSPSIKPVANGSATLKGNITWQYNRVIGTKPDVGATVILFPINNKATTSAELVKVMDGKIPASTLGIYHANVDGYGTYELNNLPAGKYVALYTSLKTLRDYKQPIDATKAKLLPYISNVETNPLGLTLFNHMIVDVQLKDNEQKVISKDWGYTY